MVNPARQKSRYWQGGFTLVEMSICLGIIVIFLSVVMTVTLVASRSYGVIRDNDELLKQERAAKAILTDTLLSADFIADAQPDPFFLAVKIPEFADTDTQSEPAAETVSTNAGIVSFVYDTEDRLLLRVQESNVTVLLRDCEEIHYRLLQREYASLSNQMIALEQPEIFPHTLSSCQSVELSWTCRRYWDEERTKPSAELSGKVLLRLRN